MQTGLQDTGRRLLMTGATGFIGSALLPLLTGLSRELMTVGRRPPPGRRARHLALDILDTEAVATAFAEARPDTVLHLAGASLPPSEPAARRAMLALNVMGTEAVLTAARECGAGHVLVVGSAAQYGPMPDPKRGLREGDPCRPVGLYGISKAAAGAMALDFGQAAGIAVTLAVPFNVIGAGQPSHLVPATFVRQIVATPDGGPARIAVGDTAAQRDWIDVRDVARAIAILAGRCRPGTYNICTGRPAPVEALLATLRDISARPIEWSVDGSRLRPDQPSVHFGDPSRITAETGWQPEIGLPQTLTDMLLAAGGRVRGTEQRIA